MATLTYVYSDSTVVLGPLAVAAEPHSYDLCEEHASRLTAPRGWEVVRVVAASGHMPMDSLNAADNQSGSFADARPGYEERAGVSGGTRASARASAPTSQSAAEEVEARRLEISQPLQRPDDDWAILADVVSSPSEALTIEIPRDVITGLRSVQNLPEPASAPTPQRAAGLRSVPRSVPSAGRNSAAEPDETRPDVVVPPRHAADPAPVQEGEIMRRGHLRVLRGEASS